jgi:hypothetical protein
LLKLYQGNPVTDLASALMNGSPAWQLYKLFNPQADRQALDALRKIPGVNNLDFNLEVDAGEKYAEQAQQYYADRINQHDENTPWYEKAADWAGGTMSSLWTCDTSTTTFDVLSTALGVNKGVSPKGVNPKMGQKMGDRTPKGIDRADDFSPQKNLMQESKPKCFNSFVAGTEVLTPDGEKNIEDIKVGDKVIADDPNTPGEIETKKVVETIVSKESEIIDLYVDGEVISTTSKHHFWIPNVGWTEAKDLKVGNRLQTEDGTVVDIDKVEKRDGEFQVYNLEVEGFHTYFVSDFGVLVHNACDPNDLTLLNSNKAWKELNDSLGKNVNIKVKTREEADSLLKQYIEGEGYRNSTGYTGNQVRQNKDLFPNGKNNTYHWDYADTQHGGVAHVQIHDADGGIKHIFFEQGGGNPITGGNLSELGNQINRLWDLQ